MDGIFISYRRDDSAGYAGRLYDRLVSHFGADRVFMDVEGIEPGLDFVEAIEQAVGSCRVLIAVIGDEWATTTDASGRRRLDDPNDFIRLETGSALQRRIRVVPVLVGGAVMPQATDLPEDLKPLTRRQAIEINHKQWEASTGELIRTLEGILSGVMGRSAQSPEGGAAGNDISSPAINDNVATDHGGARRWIWPVAVTAASIAAVSFWMPPDDGGVEIAEKPVGDSPVAPVAPATLVPETTIPSGPASAAPSPAVVSKPVDKKAPAQAAPASKSKPAPPSFTLTPKQKLASAPSDKSLQHDPPSATPAMPGATGSSATSASSSLPLKGERWLYRASGKWPTSPKRRFEIVVQGVSDGVVTDKLVQLEPEQRGEVGRTRGNSPGFIAWNVIGVEFSPYFGAYVALAQQGSMSGFTTPDTDSQWTQWYSKVSINGQESVSVPAGTFNAYKVEVSSTRTQTGSFAQAQIEPVRIRYLIWYVPEIKRYVRMQRSVKAADGSESENDVIELLSHGLL